MDSVTAILKVTKQSSLSELSVLSTRFDKRIEFHLARKQPPTGFSNGGGTFQLEAMSPDTSNTHSNDYQLPKKVDASEATDNGLDQELSFGITFRRIGAGLANLGNTCFLNSVLQCLTYTEPLAAYLQSGKHQSSCRTSGFCALCAIQKHVSSALQSTGRILVPKEIVSNLRCISGNFRNSRQEDAHEYMVSLLESMHKCCLPSGVPSESPSAYDKSSVHKIFGGQLCSQVKCMQCSFSSDKFEPFLDLSLEIVKVDSLYKALVQFTAKEFLDGGESHYQCQQCKQKVKALKQLTIHKAPYVLTVHLKRFGAHLDGQKIDKKICFETTLDLKPFVTDPCLQDGDLKYTLYGVLVHAGWSTHSGHYYCFVRTSTGLWYSLDDNRVIQVGEKMVLEQKAYMLFYYRDRRHSSSLKSFDVAQKHNAESTEIAKLYGGLGQGFKETLRGQIGTKVNGVISSTPIAQINSFNGAEPRKPIIKDAPAERLATLVKNHSSPGGVECLVQKDSSDKSSAFQLEDNSIITLSNAKSVECGQDTSDEEQANNLIVAASRSETILKSVNDSTLCDSGGILPKGSNSENSQKGLDDSVATSTSCPLPEISPIVIAEETEKVFSGEDPSWRSMDKTKAVMTATTTYIKYIQATVPEASTLPATKHKSTQRKVHDEKSNGRLKKKFSKFPTMKMHLSSKISLGTFLSVRKKHKSRKGKLVTTNLIQERLVDGNNSPDVEPSTSQKCQTTQFGGLNHSKRRRENCGFKKEKCCVVNNMVLNLNGDPMANNKVERKEKTEENCAMLVFNDLTQRKTASGSAANSLDDRGPCHSKDSTKESLQNRSICSKDNRNDSMKNGLMSVLTRGLEETIVARWDEMGSYATHPTEQSDRGNGSIGYVGDEWDEEYDRGKRKKIRSFKDDFSGPNPFQEIATMKTKMKKARMGYSTSGNKPFRI